MNNVENALWIVNRSLSERGHRPDRFDDLDAFRAAVSQGLLTPIRGAWGHRLTDKGVRKLRTALERDRALEAAHHERIRALGFDPNKTLSEMTKEEVDEYVRRLRPSR